MVQEKGSLMFIGYFNFILGVIKFTFQKNVCYTLQALQKRCSIFLPH